MKALVMFYSTYGHTWQLAEAVKEGIHEVTQDVTLKRIPELLSDSVLKALRALEFQKKIEHVPVVSMEELADYDLLFFGSPTRFGNMIGQMRMFLDSTGPLWSTNALTGKVGSCFTSSATQHVGQESTILSMYNTLIHHGMIVVGLPYSFKGQSRIDEITGCSPYGTSTISGPSGERMPSENELNGARFQGKFAAQIAKRIFE